MVTTDTTNATYPHNLSLNTVTPPMRTSADHQYLSLTSVPRRSLKLVRLFILEKENSFVSLSTWTYKATSVRRRLSFDVWSDSRSQALISTFKDQHQGANNARVTMKKMMIRSSRQRDQEITKVFSMAYGMCIWVTFLFQVMFWLRLCQGNSLVDSDVACLRLVMVLLG